MIIVMACLGLTSNDLNDMQTKVTVESNGMQFAPKPRRRPTSTFQSTSMYGSSTVDRRVGGADVFVDIKGNDFTEVSDDLELTSSAGGSQLNSTNKGNYGVAM